MVHVQMHCHPETRLKVCPKKKIPLIWYGLLLDYNQLRNACVLYIAVMLLTTIAILLLSSLLSSLTPLCNSCHELEGVGTVFIDSVCQLITLLLDYRSISADEPNKGMRMGCILNLLVGQVFLKVLLSFTHFTL